MSCVELEDRTVTTTSTVDEHSTDQAIQYTNTHTIKSS